jgi:hypothetical protein
MQEHGIENPSEHSNVNTYSEKTGPDKDLRRQEEKSQDMRPKHRLLHRRQALEVPNLTVVVNVVAEVDVNGNTMAVSTATETAPVTQVPLPSVPSVPPFPSDLTVPAVPQIGSVSIPQVPPYPFATSTTTGETVSAASIQTPVSQASSTSPGSSVQIVLSSPPSTPLPITSPLASTPSPLPSIPSNGTLSSIASPILSVAGGNLTVSGMFTMNELNLSDYHY